MVTKFMEKINKHINTLVTFKSLQENPTDIDGLLPIFNGARSTLAYYIRDFIEEGYLEKIYLNEIYNTNGSGPKKAPYILKPTEKFNKSLETSILYLLIQLKNKFPQTFEKVHQVNDWNSTLQ